MGRVRAKAKQTKVARTLKYQDIGTDLHRLADELHSDPTSPSPARTTRPPAEEELDPRYSQWADFQPGQRDTA